jgi:hypothetical protein
MRPARLYSIYTLMVLAGSVFTSRIAWNWLDSRIDEQMTERTPALTAFVVTVARWGIANPGNYVACVLVVGGAFIALLLVVKHFSTKAMISIDGVDSYLSKHVTEDGRCYIVAADVTITNHRTDRPASIGAEFETIEIIEMAATNSANGRTEMVRNPFRVQSEVIEPVLTQLTSGAHFTPGRKSLEFPLHLSAGETQRGYIAFQVWNKTLHEDVPASRNSGTLVFKDYGTRTDIRRFPKTEHYLLGTYGTGRVRPTPPVIEVSVGSGSRASILVQNQGGAFKLKARARIMRASEPIDSKTFYEFEVRDVAGGHDLSSYTLATVSMRQARIGFVWVVKIHGELMAVVQRWEGAAPFWCELEWVFLQVSDSQLVHLCAQTVRLSLSPDRQSLVAEIINPATAA